MKSSPLQSTLRLLLGIIALGPWSCLAQSPGESEQSTERSASTTSDSSERDKLWNSKEMLDARAYLETYFQRSAKISSEQAAKYMADLKALDADQLRVWLIKFQDDRNQSKQQYERGRQLEKQASAGALPAQQVGGFKNPFAGKTPVSSGLPVGTNLSNSSGNRNVFTSSPSVQKPFSSPAYERSIRPLVTSEEAARYTILRGIGGWGPFPL